MSLNPTLEFWQPYDERLPEKLLRPRPDTAFLESIKEGQITPIILSKQKNNEYKLLAGNKRLLAFRVLVDEDKIPRSSTVMVLIYTELTPELEQLVIIEENAHRSPNMFSDALAIRKLVEMGHTLETIAETIHRPVPYVSKALHDYEQCPDWTLQAVLDNKMSISTVKKVGTLPADKRKKAKKMFEEHGHLTGTQVDEMKRTAVSGTVAALIPQNLFTEQVKAKRPYLFRDELMPLLNLTPSKAFDKLKELLA